uniref:Uncharacterized protein n=1 Tax=Anguilla anguilla TaxID=7936 RepID=A0A0E9S4I7_ANGAN
MESLTKMVYSTLAGIL